MEAARSSVVVGGLGGGWMNRGAQRIFKAVEILCMMLCSSVYAILHLSKPIDSTAQS